ncbi:MAG: SUMF1/EgtB/PvdO family nonheme iron enzyme [Anaerolineae bacterium]|nr:SUMF1/EgtB/PvdO family nonheme iron enzyme [Anaerolineae bacterium]
MVLAAQTVLQNRYRIVTLLGQGGMGAVYRAWDLRLEGPVAVKEFVPQPGLDAVTLGQLRAQFKQEAVILSRLSHPNLVRVRDFFEEQGNAYLVMDLVEGESLEARILRQKNIPEEEAVVWMRQLLEALVYCHSRGVVHRDIKPQNVIIDQQGCAILVDFGLVKLWNPHDPQTRTVLRGMGTPEYAPPEQYGKQGQTTDPRSDLYSLGATFYHALAGQAPPTASDRMADPHLFHPVRGLNPRVSTTFDTVILRAMEPAREARYASAAEMHDALIGQWHAEGRPMLKTDRRGTRQMAQVSPPEERAFLKQNGLPLWVWMLLGVAGLASLIWGVSTLAGRTTPRPEIMEKTVVVTQEMMQVVTATSSPTANATPTETSTPLPIATATPTETPPPSPTPSATLTQTPTPLPPLSVGSTRTRAADRMVMVYVPAGEFQMGSEEGDDEKPVHAVALGAYWLDRTEVSVAQFQKFVSATGYVTEAEKQGWSVARIGSSWGEVRGADWLHPAGPGSLADVAHPVVNVSWEDAVAYCRWAGGRLPTEAEWEYAARGLNGLRFPWGDTFDGTRLNFCDINCPYDSGDRSVSDGYESTAPVGSNRRGASWVGALDLAGNVWEWVVDLYGPYPSERQVNPSGPQSGEGRVLRGGSWGNSGGEARTANRNWVPFSASYDGAGLRCMVVASP